jgi:hypothetical protein
VPLLNTILREERYIIFVGSQELVLRIQEFLSGTESWPGRFRLNLPASDSYKARTFYGGSSFEVAREAVEYLESKVTQDPNRRDEKSRGAGV